ncbi:MAG: alginate export family protein [Bryobacteraceae bacterium]|nr:alginate export family protein [Bryobacteraceae bacterium]
MRSKLLAWMILASGCSATPQEIHMIRYEESWQRTRQESIRPRLLDPLKFIPLRSRDGWFATVGGDVRTRYEYFKNPSWGLEPPDDSGYLLQRYMVHTDFHFGRRIRFFGQLKSGIENGRSDGPRPLDKDKLDVHQGFFEVEMWRNQTSAFAIRAGRQEVSLGSSRLVGIREGPNIRLGFDGARATLRGSKWSVDLLVLRPVETKRGVFDDAPDHTQSLWGVYATGPGRHTKLDLYYLGLDRRVRQFEQGRAREQRHSFGARYFGKKAAWDFDYETVWQGGSFGPAAIRAWTVASNTGYTHDFLRIGLKADIASGDRNPSDRTLGTFNALFPKGAYFNQADLLGPYNIADLHPSVTFRLSDKVSITPDADFFWRQSLGDGIYDMPGNLIAAGAGKHGRYIGSNINIAVAWQPTRQFSLEAHYLRFFPGPFLKSSGLNLPVNFVGLWTTFRF